MLDRCKTINEQVVTFYKYYEGIRSVLFDDDLDSVTYLLEVTSIHKTMATNRYVDQDDQPLDDEHLSMEIASYIVWLESVRANPGRINGMSKEKGEVSVICQKDYQENEMITTLECKHGYHEDCIKTLLMQKNVCPICRACPVI
ncbi:hypothetical protein R6Q59_030097 [Mikania micrantha]